MTSAFVRQAYFDYLKARNHKLIQRAPLVLQGDATTLFTGSGMQPLLPYLLGAKHPAGKRLVNSQICLRTQDIEEVGDLSHTTCFEMLGNWSLGDYFKKEQLSWFFDFLVDCLKLDVNRLYATCFRGDSQHRLAKDQTSAQILKELYAQRGLQAKIVDLKNAKEAADTGMQAGRIFYYDDAENWWSRGGGIAQTPLGDPAGGDCEFFFDFGEDHHDQTKYGQAHPASDSARFLEIGNSVFMQYQKQKTGFSLLESKNVDFGGGLERLVSAANNQVDVFQTDLLYPLIDKLQTTSQLSYSKQPVAFRIIVDHWRAASWLALDGVIPSNKEQGYVMRRLMRRALLQANRLNLNISLSQTLVPLICQIYASAYSEFTAKEAHITQVLLQEEKTFRQTLSAGWREFQKLTKQQSLSGADLFKLYDTYGFPKELSLEEAKKANLKIEPRILDTFQRLMQAQRQRSRTTQVGQYKGGLADSDPLTVQYHTATHLMYQALCLVLGKEVKQRGSNINNQRLRFDFSYHQKVNPQQIAEIEAIVNQQIEADWPVRWQIMETQAALKEGVLGAFGDKYGEQVRVYSIGPLKGKPFSKEICGGPHVERTSELGQAGRRFKIIKEEACSAGVRRIKAVLRA